MHLYLDLSLDLREGTHSRPVSQISFRQPVETITAPCLNLYCSELFTNSAS
ncbi:hypothetical protein H1P_1160002 [Hyella patelloides LEGE 07179]|uniref:Uncharacterized protein n=1 Tax=Hyella patelloides LEGE 07179 TaxID=945734 RepID=A0A563VJY1_9CYAN|nr:hypothetical protein H1P_1160002 [Hyella patelloides LEGE 07179]